MKRTTLLLALPLVCLSQIPSGTSESATTPRNTSESHSYTKSPSAKSRIKMPVGGFTVWFDETKWKREKSDTDGVFKFSSINGAGWAIVTASDTGMSTDDLSKVVLLDEQRQDPNLQVILQEKRIVNGREVLAIETAGSNRGIPFKHLGYYYGGTSGNIGVVTYSIAAAVDDNINLFTEFLNGLEITDQDSQSNASEPTTTRSAVVVSFNSNMSLKYDPHKWRPLPSKEEGHYYFSYFLGDGYAVISPNPLPIPTDTFPEVALANAKSTDPNAAITSLEKRTVNGALVWFIKTETTFNKTPMVYYGYYFGGKHNSVQILAYTTKALSPQHERDFLEFLNGFSVSEQE